MKTNTLKIVLILSFYSFFGGNTFSQKPKEVKNVIIMIPDGTSTSVLSLSRWYKSGIGYSEKQNIDNIQLNIDPYICGLVKTHSSDAPIGDSAPTGSTYATGVVSQSAFVSTYPQKTKNDIVSVDATLANTPAMTILEAAKLKGKATGLVVTCEFPHATPADFSSHYYNRNKYEFLAPQMVHNNIDVVFGGGTDYLDDNCKNYLQSNQWEIITDYNQLKSFSGKKVWGLFAPKEIPYELDRDTTTCPSLEELTDKALEVLSQNEEGFFLMIEGSKIDWCAHANDPAGIITEFLAFDKAVKKVMDFAQADGQTAVIICPDHGNSAVSIGNMRAKGYDKIPKDKIIEPLIKYKSTTENLSKLLYNQKADSETIKKYFSSYMDIHDLKPVEIDSLLSGLQQQKNAIDKTKKTISNIITSRTYIGFTTTGHTGEDVFLAMYHPQGDIMTGVVHNTQINQYMQQIMGIGSLADSTKKYFCGHKTLFPESEYNYEFDVKLSIPTLTITSNKTKQSISLKAFDNIAVLNKKKQVACNTVFIYVDKNKEFYLPVDLKKLID